MNCCHSFGHNKEKIKHGTLMMKLRQKRWVSAWQGHHECGATPVTREREKVHVRWGERWMMMQKQRQVTGIRETKWGSYNDDMPIFLTLFCLPTGHNHNLCIVLVFETTTTTTVLYEPHKYNSIYFSSFSFFSFLSIEDIY